MPPTFPILNILEDCTKTGLMSTFATTLNDRDGFRDFAKVIDENCGMF